MVAKSFCSRGGDDGGAAAYRGDVVGLSAMFEQQSDNVGVALLRRLVEGSVTHLHTVIDLFIDLLITDLYIFLQGLKQQDWCSTLMVLTDPDLYNFHPSIHPAILNTRGSS